jgi:hypothetical protein
MKDFDVNEAFMSSDDDYASLWVGNCISSEKFQEYIHIDYDKVNDGYFGFHLGEDYGIASYDHDFFLLNFLENTTRNVEELLEIGAADSLIEYFKKTIGETLNDDYNCCIMLFDTKYEGSIKRVEHNFGYFEFLGYIKCDKFEMISG